MPTKLVDGVRVQTTAQEDAQKAADEAAWLAKQSLPETHTLSRLQWLELIYDGTREAEIEAHLQTLGPAAKRTARAYRDGNVGYDWNDAVMVQIRSILSEGEASLAAAWVAKGKE